MSLDRLTEKAVEVVTAASSHEKLTSKVVLKLIEQSDGMGGYLLETIPPVTIKKLQKVDLPELVKEAYFQAIRLEHPYVGTEHIYLALLKLQKSRHLERAKVELVKKGVFPNALRQQTETEAGKKTPMLDAFGEDLNHKALRNASAPLVYREEYEQLVSTLLLKERANALIVGESGVGKGSLVRLLAHNINALEVPPALVGYNIRTINLLAFMTSIANKGGLEFGITSVIDELKSLKRVIVVLENFQDIFFATPAGLTIPIFYSILKNQIEEAGISVVTYLTPGMYEKLAAENEHIVDNLSLIELDEPSEAQTKEILKTSARTLEDFHNVEISKDIINYIYKRALPAKAIKFPQKGLDLMDYACANVIARRSNVPENYKGLVDKSFDLAGELDKALDAGSYDQAMKVRRKMNSLDMKLDQRERQIFSSTKALVLTKKDVDLVLDHLDFGGADDIDAKGATKFGQIAAKIKKEIIGQDEAVDVVSRALIRAKLGLRSRKRPLGNFLFLGPTGVGKTELAKVLAKHAFAEDDHTGLIRLDMSDFSEKHNVARLVGAPPGYVGFGEGGELTSKIESHPKSVVLFDEIEKAHPDVLNILLQIMEEGELTDARGNTFDFSKSVVILTSNLGTEILHNKGIGFDESEVSDQNLEGRLKNNLKKILKPELINRFDEAVVFKRLTKADTLAIINLLVKEVTDTLAKQEVSLKVTLTVKKWLIEKGYSKEYGARSLRRTIEKELLDSVAAVLLLKQKRPLKLKAKIVKDKLVIL